MLKPQTLKGWVTQPLTEDRSLRRALSVAFFVLATALAANLAVPLPLTPIPLSLQTLFVLLAGALLGPWLGATAMAVYLGVGMMGLPVFSNGATGIAWLLGSTGGYLVAFPAAAFVVGWIARDREAGTLRLVGALLAGTIVVFAGGVSQLFIVTGQSLATLIALGVAPFLLGAIIKLAVALLIVVRLRPASLERP